MPRFEYECLVSRQRDTVGAPTFLLFHAPAGDVLQWAAIKRLEDEPGAPQRQTSPAKVKAIRRFLDTDERNTIPTSVIVTLDLGNGEFTEPQAPSSVARIQFEWNEGTPKPGLVINGQHRLYGIEAFDRETQVNLVAITGARRYGNSVPVPSNQQQSFQSLAGSHPSACPSVRRGSVERASQNGPVEPRSKCRICGHSK